MTERLLHSLLSCKTIIVRKAKDLGWNALGNGELLKAAEASGFQILITTDKNIRYQQNLMRRKIALVVLGNSRWPIAKRYADKIVAAVNGAAEGSYNEVETPNK